MLVKRATLACLLTLLPPVVNAQEHPQQRPPGANNHQSNSASSMDSVQQMPDDMSMRVTG